MKRLLAFIMAVVTVVLCASQMISAQTLEAADGVAEAPDATYSSLGSGAVTFVCEYSEDAKRIEISGNVNYNILVMYGKYNLEILRIVPTQTVEAALASDAPDVAARMDIAARFELSFEIKKAVERFSKYAVVLRSPEGEAVLASEPQYINVASKYMHTSSDRSAFKGIMPSGMAEVSVSGDLGYGCAIIPVYYNKLINESMNGYMYPHEDTHCFFDKTYIDELDSKIRTYSATGARVYLQLLLPSSTQGSSLLGTGGEVVGADYDMPDVYDEATLSRIYTYVKFLVSRYNGYTDGQIGGIIVGKQIDTQKYNYNGGLSVEAYAEKYAFYLMAVANTARMENADIDVVIPLGNFNSYSGVSVASDAGYSPSVLLENIASFMDGVFRTEFKYSTMLEASSVPVGIVEMSADGGESVEKYVALPEAENAVGVNNLAVYDAFLSKLSTSYRSAPDSYIYCWQIPEGIFGNALECSYAYSYYTLLSDSRVSSFVVSFAQADAGAAESIKKTVGAIDTVNGKKESAKLLPYFGADSWGDIVKSYTENGLVLRTLYSSTGSLHQGSNWLGSFSYFDFSTGDTDGWYGASYSKSLRLDYGDGGQRVLRQTVGKTTGGAHSDLFCLYEYDESLIYTPALEFKMKITDGEPSVGAIYEITVTVGTEGSSVSKSSLVRSGELCELWLDVEGFGGNNKASYVKISTRSVSGEADEYSLWVYDAVGYSNVYDSEMLGSLISAERQSIRNQSNSDEDGADDNIIYWIVFSIILVAIFIGGIMITVLRRDESGERRRRRKQ